MNLAARANAAGMNVAFIPRPNGTQGPKRIAVTAAAQVIEQGGFTFDTTTEIVGLQVLDDDVWCTFDGTTPAATNALKLPAGIILFVDVPTAQAAKFLRVTTDAQVHALQCVL